ncbi:MAG: PorT family protein [Bacteroidetes Order II. Incertae sedis bacterium]|nr:PorT family protein [Bacteroidetes Order II. bacterium]
MKNTFFLLAVLLLVSLPATAQRLEYGLKGGTNISLITDADYKFKSINVAPGFMAGLYARTNTRRIGAQIEVIYASKQWSTEEQRAGQSNTQILRQLDTKNGYVSVPLMLYAKIGRIDIGAGPQINALLTSVAKGQELIKNIQSGNTEAIKDLAYDYLKDKIGEGGYADIPTGTPQEGSLYEKMGLDANFGLGLNLKRTRIEGRLNYGLTDVMNNYYVKFLNPAEYENSEKLISGQVILSIKL